jgi:hypothetical protein
MILFVACTGPPLTGGGTRVAELVMELREVVEEEE